MRGWWRWLCWVRLMLILRAVIWCGLCWGGEDAASFSLTSGGVLSFVAAKDFESPDDVGGDGDYRVTVGVSDGTGSDSADLVVVVGNVVELASVISGPTVLSVEENSYGPVASFTASSVVDHAGVEWVITGADAGHFSVDKPGGGVAVCS